MRKNVDVQKLRTAVEAYAQKAGIKEEEFLKIEGEAAKEMEERGLDGEEKEYYTLKRIQLGLKMRFSSSSQEAEGFFIGKQNPFDYAKKPRETVEDFIREQGKLVAKEAGLCDNQLKPIDFVVDVQTNIPTTNFSQEDETDGKVKRVPAMTPEDLSNYIYNAGVVEARNRSMVDSEGKFIYLKPDFKKGKPIPEHDWGSVAYGVFKMPGDDEPKLATVTLRGDNATGTLPLFKVVRFPARVNKNKTSANHYELSMIKPVNSVGEDVDYWAFDEMITQGAPDRRLEDLQELPSFIQNHDEFRTWCIFEADIMDVGVISPEYDSVAVRVTDMTLDSFNSDDAEITFWVNKDIAVGLMDSISDVIFVANPYIKNDGTVSGNIIGYWVDPAIMPEPTGEIPTGDVLKPW
jgi:hypothetical protein